MSQRPAVYFAFPTPVVLVTMGCGREEYHDSRKLFDRLAEMPAKKDTVLAIWHGDQAVHETGVSALNCMVHLVGFAPFKRAMEGRQGPERVFRTKWSWEGLTEYLGFRWVQP